MHFLLFLTGAAPQCEEDFLHRAGRTLRSVLPPLPLPLRYETTWLHDVPCGWLTVVPETPGLRPRIQSLVDGDLAVVVYGEVFGGDAGSRHAHLIADAWRLGGCGDVRALDGCFSAVIVDRKRGECVAVTDIIGRRALRYCRARGLTAFATHDLVLAATGLVTPVVEEPAVASAAAFGWSLGGVPLLTDVRACQPDEVVSFNRTDVVCSHDRRLKARDRIGARDTSALGAHLDVMVSHLQEVTAAFCGTASPVKTDLTAGLDSRCVLALLMAAVPRTAIITGTQGTERSLDVVVARRIAARYGLAHEVLVHDPPEPGRVRERLGILACVLNGDTDGKRALTDIFTTASHVDPTPRLYGLASEIYRGYYYPSLSRSALLHASRSKVIDHLRRRTSLIDVLPWKASETPELLAGLLGQRLDRLEAMAESPPDLFDLFYVFERFAHWGSLSARATWWSQYFAPFSSTDLLMSAFRLPAPIGFGVPLQRAILSRLLPRSFAFPLINGTVFAPSLKHPAAARRLSTVIGHAGAAADRLTRLLGREAEGDFDSMDGWAALQFGGSMRSTVEEILLHPRSLTLRMLKEEEVARQLGLMGGGVTGLAGLGSLLTAEVWKEQIERACIEAARTQGS